jgi:hypothetical protein
VLAGEAANVGVEGRRHVRGQHRAQIRAGRGDDQEGTAGPPVDGQEVERVHLGDEVRHFGIACGLFGEERAHRPLGFDGIGSVEGPRRIGVPIQVHRERALGMLPRPQRRDDAAQGVLGHRGAIQAVALDRLAHVLDGPGPGPGAQVRQVDRDRTHTGGLQQRAGQPPVTGGASTTGQQENLRHPDTFVDGRPAPQRAFGSLRRLISRLTWS